MKDILDEVINHIRSGWRYRWYALSVAWVVALIGWAVVYTIPDKYGASARVYVDTKSVLKPLLRGLAVEGDIREQLAMMTKTLLSRPNIEQVIRESDLDLTVKNSGEMDALIQSMMKGISISRGRGKNLFTIKYTHVNPEVAKRVVQELLNIFVESSIGDERVEAETATRFLNEQIAAYEAKLVAAENRLTEFKRDNVGKLPSQGGDIFQRLQQVKSQHQNEKLNLAEAEKQRDELKNQLNTLLDQVESAEAEPAAKDEELNPFQQRIVALELIQDELLLKYTEQHPDVIEIQRKISSLEAKAKAKAKEIRESGGTNDLLVMGGNEALDQLKLQLATVEAEVAALKVREREFFNRVGKTERLMNTIPEVEAALTRLNRDYAINKKNYDMLSERRESAAMSKDVDEAGDNVKFRIIDPPHAPSTPVSSKRELLSAVVLVAAFALGGALAFLLSQLKPVYFDTSILRRETEFPVFGSVSRIWTPELKRKRSIEVFFFIIFSMILILFFAAVEAMYFIGGADQLLLKMRGLM